jgi:hypothetical protein
MNQRAEPEKVSVTRRFAPMPLIDAAETAAEFLPDGLCFSASPGQWQATRAAHIEALDDQVYEARWFGVAGEVRWLRRGDSGRVAVVALHDETASISVPSAAWEEEDKSSVLVKLVRSSRCWGKVVEVLADEQVLLHEARIAPVKLPLSRGGPTPDIGDHLVLQSLELVGDVGDGNQRVIDEVLSAVQLVKKGTFDD